MKISDIIEIEQMYNYYEVGLATNLYDNLPYLYTQNDPKATIMRTGITKCGTEEIFDFYAGTHGGKRGAPRYDTWHTGAQICVPLIEIDENGMTARGRFPTHGYFVYDQGSDHMPPYDVDSTWEMWFDDFVKENQIWKLKHFHFISMTANKIWKWNPEGDTGYAVKCALSTIGGIPFDIDKYKREYEGEGDEA